MRPENTRVLRKGLRASDTDRRERRRTDRKSRVRDAHATVAQLPVHLMAHVAGKLVPPADAD